MTKKTVSIKTAMGPGRYKQAVKAALLSIAYVLVSLLRMAGWFCFGGFIGYLLTQFFGEAAMTSTANTLNTTLGTTWFSASSLITTFAAAFAAWKVL